MYDLVTLLSKTAPNAESKGLRRQGTNQAVANRVAPRFSPVAYAKQGAVF
jgi:hypothetical protein